MTLTDALRGGPITQPDLARVLGCTERQVREMLQTARLEGHPIASGPEGMWIATSADELAGSNRRLRHRLKSQYSTLRAQQNTERRMRIEESRPLAFFVTDEAA